MRTLLLIFALKGQNMRTQGGRKMIKFCGRPLWMAPYTTPEKPQATTVTPEMNEQVYRKLSSLRDR